jgi:magnesium transporter
MLAILKTAETGLERLEEFEPGSWIDLVSPTEEELRRVSGELDIPLDLLKGPLDEEEKSRVEVEDGLTYVIVDIPVLVVEDDERSYATIPLGMIFTDYHHHRLRINPILGEFERERARFTQRRGSFAVLHETVHLRFARATARRTRKELRASMKSHLRPLN